ncbi:MAG TPA: DUF401 family protein [bacterium]|nr:DUF401 family protein [bacterium]
MTDILPLIKIFVILAVIGWFIRLKLNIGVNLFLASIPLAFLFNFDARDWLQSAAEALSYMPTLTLAAVIISISVFCRIWKATGRMDELVRSFAELVSSRRLSLMFFPSIVGLLPMPGGAFFSAPLVQAAARKTSLTVDDQATINYWFRHVWEFVWPLYPAMLWFSETYKVPLVRIIPYSGVITLSAIIGGNVVLFRRLGSLADFSIHLKKLPAFLKTLSPLLILAFIAITSATTLPLLHTLLPESIYSSQNIPLMIGVVCATLFLVIRNHLSLKTVNQHIRSADVPGLAAIVLGVMIFKEMLTDSGAATDIGAAFQAVHIPAPLFVVVFPLFLGALLSYTMSSLSIALPIVIASVGINPADMQAILPYFILVFASTFFGVMLTPLHACFALTREYFQASWGGMLKRVAPAYLFPMTAAIIMFVLMKQ